MSDSRAAGSLGGCANEAVAAHDDGFLFYLPGCRDTGVTAGNSSDASFKTIVSREDVAGEGESFLALARHPEGAVAVLPSGLVLMTRDGKATQHWFPRAFAAQLKHTLGVALVVGPSGTPYLVAAGAIYKLTLSRGTPSVHL